MKSRILAAGALGLALTGVIAWQVAEAQGAGPGPYGPGVMGGYGMGPGMMGGYGMGPGMMGGNGMGPGMMGGYGMGPGMMGGYGMGPGMMGFGWGGQQINRNLSVSDVKAYFDRWIAVSGNPHIKVGSVTEKDADTITADIVTTDKDALVQRYAINRHSGFFQPAGN